MQIYPLGYFPYVWVINADGTAQTEIGEGFDPAWRPAVSGPAVALSPGSLAFGSQLIGTASAPQAVSLTNTGSADLTISGIAASGDFTQTNNCGSSVAAGAGCTVSVRFTPTASGPRSGAITITDNATGSPHVVSLGGTGNNPPNNPPVVSFVSVCTRVTCSFDGSTSSDPDGTITSHAWNFGDGTTGSGSTVSHTYAACGTYPVTLTVKDNGGASTSQSTNVTVTQCMHIGDLNRASTKQGSTWTASVTVSVHDGSHSGVPNATVIWSSGGTGSCTTSTNGKCTVSKSGISKNTASVTFTVGTVTHGTLFYTSAGNHEPDGDSNGTSIVVNKP